MTFDKTTTAEVSRWWDERPCNVKHSSKPITSVDYSVDVTSVTLRREPHRLHFMQPERWRGKYVFEAGCGIGTDSLIFARFGAIVTAVDISPRSLWIATLRARATGFGKQILFSEVDFEEPLVGPDARGPFGGTPAPIEFPPDLIYSFGVIHHTPHPDRALRHLREIADMETELRIMLYHRWSTKALRLGLTNKRIARGSEARPGCPVTYAYSRRGARRLLRKAGWRTTSVKIDHILPWKGEPLGRGEYVAAFPWRFVPVSVRQALAKVIGWHLLIVARPA